jgi:hypothetical protein
MSVIEHCPTCGAAVTVSSGADGTNHYLPVNTRRERETVATAEQLQGAVEKADRLDALCRDAISLAEHLVGYVVGSKERAKLMEQIDSIRAAVNAEMNRQDQ